MPFTVKFHSSVYFFLGYSTFNRSEWLCAAKECLFESKQPLKLHKHLIIALESEVFPPVMVPVQAF